nr:helix-turn-helix transcriptional regulator [Bianquea renquensis]
MCYDSIIKDREAPKDDAQGLHNKAVGKLAEVSRLTVSAVKNGRSCSDDTGWKIAAALDVDLAEILED